VTGTPSKGAVLTKVSELLAFARLHGYRREDIIMMIEAMS
jgi:hypothetical protein